MLAGLHKKWIDIDVCYRTDDAGEESSVNNAPVWRGTGTSAAFAQFPSLSLDLSLFQSILVFVWHFCHSQLQKC